MLQQVPPAKLLILGAGARRERVGPDPTASILLIGRGGELSVGEIT